RMTLYRRFANKQELVEATLLREVAWFLTDLQREFDAHDTVEDKLTEGFVFTVETLRDHDLLNRLLATEPESTVPHFTVQGAHLPGAAALAARPVVPLVRPRPARLDRRVPAGARGFASAHLGPLRNAPARAPGPDAAADCPPGAGRPGAPAEPDPARRTPPPC